MDRVGGGDSFASGLIYGLMSTGDAELAVNYGAAHGALAMTIPLALYKFRPVIRPCTEQNA